MSQPTVIGYMKEQPQRLAYVYENRNEFVDPFVEVFKENNIKKVIIFLDQEPVIMFPRLQLIILNIW